MRRSPTWRRRGRAARRSSHGSLPDSAAGIDEGHSAACLEPGRSGPFACLGYPDPHDGCASRQAHGRWPPGGCGRTGWSRAAGRARRCCSGLCPRAEPHGRLRPPDEPRPVRRREHADDDQRDGAPERPDRRDPAPPVAPCALARPATTGGRRAGARARRPRVGRAGSTSSAMGRTRRSGSRASRPRRRRRRGRSG